MPATLDHNSSFESQIITILQPLLSGHTSVALTTFPHHWNVGDSAIWMGTLHVLEKMGITVTYVCDYRTYDKNDLIKNTPEGPILICGGGNFGDIYQNEAGLRTKVLTDFPDRKIIQLPQSLWFSSDSAAQPLKKLIDQHTDFTLLVRDKQSMGIAKNLFNTNIQLCPDIALSLNGTLSKVPAYTYDLMVLRRIDSESRGDSPLSDSLQGLNTIIHDWLPEDSAYKREYWSLSTRLAAKIVNYWVLRGEQGKRRLLPMRVVLMATKHVATERTLAGTRLLAKAQAVVTDRLHAGLMAWMIGRPTILVDNAYHKNLSLYKAWLGNEKGIVLANDFQQATFDLLKQSTQK